MKEPKRQSKTCQSVTVAAGSEIPLALRKCKLSKVGLTFDASLTISEWRAIGSQLNQVSGSLNWFLGDWFNAGAKFTKSIESGDQDLTAREIGEICGLEAQTIWNCAAICRSVETSRRREELSYSHHVEVAGMTPPEQDKWLERAIECGWSVADMRAAIGGRETEGKASAFSFVPQRMVMDCVRWFRVEMRSAPIDKWPIERRNALREEFKPLIEILNAL